ncbi:Eco57I restriction-modification methylase domain-containing protein, partial [Treponema endosymbiont of Eucomonympha sp.]|uniref:Eco57I restriction-modification methylase domain-containing protein n=1 Tax=Treponema endosymbiont of Eucomonympha sp. TaxID=1580831 RepID=UPI000A4ADB8B
GNIYEKFLGKTIYFRGVKGTADGVRQHTAVIEEKPEVRKAGGVYYTPQYVVDYIVRHTVGVLIKDKTPEEIAALRFADPACGSGSFLVGAYQHLLNYHLDYYRGGKNAKAALKAERLYESARGAYKLTIAEKQRILQNNIYGVDIDSQAVEVTKLSLYLKLLESEGRETEGQLFKYSDMTLLPSLEDNIKCGNSLIGTDFYAQGDLGLTEDEQFKVNCFDWEREFPAVFRNGGFDAVIGNPPYVNIANIESQFERNYYKNNFKAATNKVDLYSLFTEKCINLLKPDGVLGYIFSNSWLGTNSFMAFREMLVKKTKVTQLVKLPAGVFHDATVTTILLFFQKTVVDKNHKIALKYLAGNEFLSFDFSLPYARIYASPNFAFNFNKEVAIKVPYIKLEKLAEFSLGIKTSDDKKFISNFLINAEYYPLLRGKDTARYSYIFHNKYIWYRPDLMAKKVGAGPRHLEYFLTPKIVIKDVATSIGATLDVDNFLVNDTLNVIYHIEKYDMKFVLALLNSKLINSWFDSNFEAGLHIKINQLGEIPIPDLDLSKKTDKTAHDNLAALADKMLSLKKREHEEPNPQVQTVLQRQIGAVDRQIDEAVYRLYGLSAEEIKAVEGEGAT